MKVFDFKGNKIDEIKDFNFNTFYIENFYDKKLSKNYIITANFGYLKSYEFVGSRIIHKYYEEDDNSGHLNLVIFSTNDTVKLIESSNDGIIRIWEFHTCKLLNKFKICNESLICICLWNEEYIFIGCQDKTIKLIDLNKNIIINNLICHNSEVVTIKKIYIQEYGECLISQGYEKEPIKLWVCKI